VEVVEEEDDQEQMTMFFDMSIENSKKQEASPEKTVQYTLDDEDYNWGAIKEMEVVDEIEVVADTADETSEKRYDLDDYVELEKRFEKATADSSLQKQEEAALDEVVTEEELVFEKKVVEAAPVKETAPTEIDPMESPIKDLLKNRVEERKRTLKDFNHKFQNNPNRIDEIEKEPAYKRQGVKLSEIEDETQVSRTSLSNDANDDQQLRSNNSFLHDNVD
jgi:cell division protein FtsZ